jgi:LuxR family maltose regulon positive regulatory protein
VPDRESLLPDLAEPLSPRDYEVLGLLARRFSNKEIADTLRISWQTVARHTSNIYQKLHVTRRRDAVERAAALGIFLPTVSEAVPSEPGPQLLVPFRSAPRSYRP